MDIDQILEAKKPPVATVDILLDPELEVRHRELSAAAEAARRQDNRENRRPEAPVLEGQLVELEDEIAEAKQTFAFTSIGRKPYSRLLDEYGPRKGNQLDAKIGFNADEFPPMLISASAVDPQITPAQAQKIWDEWSDAETTQLFQAAMRANKEIVDIPFTRNGFGPPILSPGKGSSTPQTTESPTPSS